MLLQSTKFEDAIFTITVSQDLLKPFFAVGYSSERVNLCFDFLLNSKVRNIEEISDLKNPLFTTDIQNSFGVMSMSFNQLMNRMALSTISNKAIVYNIDQENGFNLYSEFQRTPGDLYKMDIHPDGNQILYGTSSLKSCSVSQLLQDNPKQNILLNPSPTYFYSQKYAPNGALCACGGCQGKLKVIELNDNKVIGSYAYHTGAIRDIKFTSDSLLLGSVSDDNHIVITDVNTGKPIITLSGHKSWVTGLAFSPSGDYFVTSSQDRTIKLWSMKSKKCEQTFSGVHEDCVWSVGISPCGKKVIGGSEDGVLSIYTLQ